MSSTTGTMATVVEFTTAVAALLDAIDYAEMALLPDRKQLETVAGLLWVQSRLAGVVHTVLGIVDRNEAAQTAYGVPTASWLAGELRYTRGQACGLVQQAKDLYRFGRLADALREGRVNDRQAAAVTGVLRKLPDDLDPDAEQAAETTMVGYCDEFDSRHLATLSSHLLEVVAPEIAEEAEACRLEREHRLAQRARQLNFTEDGHGSTLIRGSLPAADAALVREQIEAIAHQVHRTSLERLDPLTDEVTWPMRRADALVELARKAAAHRVPPVHGGDRPHLVISIDYHQLVGECRRAGLADGTRLTASQLRHYACDAGILPVILGGPSGVLDVGREQRLVTTDLRKALHARDQGCVFPGCDRAAADCDAHHIIPWQQDGDTSLTNLCLLCKHHHNLLEPDPRRTVLQWQVRISEDGIAEVIPPAHVDKHRRPRRHQRFRAPG